MIVWFSKEDFPKSSNGPIMATCFHCEKRVYWHWRNIKEHFTTYHQDVIMLSSVAGKISIIEGAPPVPWDEVKAELDASGGQALNDCMV